MHVACVNTSFSVISHNYQFTYHYYLKYITPHTGSGKRNPTQRDQKKQRRLNDLNKGLLSMTQDGGTLESHV